MTYRFCWWWGVVCVLVAVVSSPLLAQEGSEDEPIEVEVVEDTEDETSIEADVSQPRFVAGMWCPLKKSTDKSAERPSDEESTEKDDDDGDAPDELGCDFGGGMRLVGRCFTQGCASLVGALGVKSLGFGLAWTVVDISNNPVSVALGVAAPYDGEGVYVDRATIVIGGTVGFGGR